jgi:hypothetical protein
MYTKNLTSRKLVTAKNLTLIIALHFLTSFYSNAQEPFTPDRPGFSTGTYTIEPGTIYLELGYEYNFSSQNIRPNYHKVPQTNIRLGLLPNFEMNVMWEGLKATDDLKFNDVFGLGAKYALVKGHSYNISLLGKLEFSNFAEGINVDPLLGLLWDYELASHLETFGVVQLGFENGQDLSTEASLGLAFPLGKHLHIHTEYFIRAYPSQSNLSHNGDIGIKYHITNDIQVDAFFATELASNAFKHIGAGFSKRF